jgi:hypothetical protein
MAPTGYPKTSANSNQHTATFQRSGDLNNSSVESPVFTNLVRNVL